MADKLPILQSGFVSLTDKDLTTPTVYNDLVISNVLSKDYRAPSNMFFYNPDIVKLYRHWCSDPNSILEMEFRERIIKLAKQCFHTDSLFKWIAIQNDLARLTDLHKTFIYDTLDYLLHGKRKIEIAQWVPLIERSIKDESVVIDAKKWLDRSIVHDSQKYLPSKIPCLIKIWCQKPRGFEDLLITLHVIFGNRPSINDVSENPKRG